MPDNSDQGKTSIVMYVVKPRETSESKLHKANIIYIILLPIFQDSTRTAQFDEAAHAVWPWKSVPR